jgi:hypothetical protein
MVHVEVVVTRVTITCPITWHERCTWIEKNCKNYVDKTNWSLWQIGQDDIYFDVEDKDAVWYNLMWE